MPLAARRWKRILLALGLAVAGLLAIWLSAPLWFPWALRPIARLANVRYARYQREGYARFSLYGFSYADKSVRFKARHVEGLTPTVWLARLAGGGGKKAPPFLSVSGWQLESVPSTKPAKPVYSQAERLAADFRFLQRWVPQIALSNGTVHVEGQTIQIPALTWSSGQLWARIDRQKLGAVVTANVTRAPVCHVRLSSAALHLESSVQVSTNAAGLTLQSTNRWWDNPVELQAQFGRTGQLPEQASLQARDFQFPAPLLHLPRYGDVRGSATGRWRQGRFEVHLSADAHPVVARSQLPPLTVELQAHGNTNRAVLDTAVVSSPWLRAALSHELAVHFTGKLLRQPATLKLAVDLNRQQWLPLSGRLYGLASFSPGTDRFPPASFELAGAGVGTAQLKARSLSIQGRLDWPMLTISNTVAVFADGSMASVSGEVALAQSLVESGQFTFRGPLVRRWLPAGYSYRSLAVAGEFRGAFTNLTHQGHLALTNLTSPDLRPLNLALDWHGRQTRVSNAVAQISAGGSSLEVTGAGSIGDGGGEIRLNALTLRQRGKPVLSLAQPARVSFHHAGWTIDPLRWAGTGGELKVQANVNWPRSGGLNVSAHDLRSALLQDFLKASVPTVELRALNLSASWSNAPVKFSLEASAAEQGASALRTNSASVLSRAAELRLGGQLKLTGDAQGLSVQKLELTSQTARVATLDGFIPLTINPGARHELVHIEPGGRLSLKGDLQAQAWLSEKLAGWTGVRLQDPHAHLELSGTPNEPQGHVRLRVQQVQPAHAHQVLPALTGLRLDLRLDRRQVRVADCHLLIQGQPASLTGEVPLATGSGKKRSLAKFINWEKASAHLVVAHADVSAFTDLYPDLLSPQGEFEVDVSLLPGFNLKGYLVVQGVRTRPLPTLGPLRDIAVSLKLHQHILELQSATANVGGTTVRMEGRADLSEADWAALSVAGANKVGAYRWVPPFSLHLFGTNVPLVRQPEAIIRGDLDLSAARTNGAPPLISGSVRLQDSYFLANLTALMPGKIEAPGRRPPYFSITNAILADWRLAVKVTGDRSLKVRTSLFNGELSANMELEGTLGTPKALGDVKIDSGIVRFPFGNLEVQQGVASLTSQNPYQPQVSVTAFSRQFGYDITMQVSGTAASPVIQFSSNPPLSSEQILLLLTAGELPQGTFSLTPQQRAQTLAMFLGRDLFAKLGFGESAEQRLTIHSGEEITQTGKPTYTIEFKLTDTLSLVGEYDRFGDYNAGVKWRIYSK
jgi:translocation and assembly module TamB